MTQTENFDSGYKTGREFGINNLSNKIHRLKVTRTTLLEIGYYSESSMDAINWHLEAYNTLLRQLIEQFKKDFEEGE